MFLKGFEATSRKVSKQFLGSFRMVLRKFQGNLRYFQECFKKVSKDPLGKFQGGFQEGFKDISRKFKDIFLGVSKIFQTLLESVSELFCF